MEYYNQLLSNLKVINPGTKYFINRILNKEKYNFLKESISILEEVNTLEPEMEKLSTAQIKGKTEEFKKRVQGGEPLDDILIEAFALVREAAKRTVDRHFDVQIIGGDVLHRGKVAEMITGEGKTLVATLPLYLNALEGKGCHLVTVNDYLAKWGVQWMGPIYHILGLSTGCIVSYRGITGQDTSSAFVFDPTYLPADSRFLYLKPASRKESYLCDITYGVGSEFGFDYLRDNMAIRKEDQVQRGLNYAIIDEVDSILIDEARTPLIISGPSEEAPQRYYEIDRLVRKLNKDNDFTVDEEGQSASLTDEGIRKCERLQGIQNLYDGTNTEQVHHINQALRAHAFFKRDKEYVVKDGHIIIVDEFTGRLMQGRRWSDGLHQAVEAKEGVKIESENQTLATISYQNYFRLYKKIAGMTGTALTESVEFREIYKLDVMVIPTNKPLNRTEYNDEIYKAEKEKFNSIVSEIETLHKEEQPILVGTASIEKAEKLSRMLLHKNIPHQVLHGKNHEAEAAIIAQAGRPKAVTIATQMAGRGVDIILGGNPAILAREETIKKIWAQKRAGGGGHKTQKEFLEIINETEGTYKKTLEEIEKSFNEKLDTLKTSLNEKEKILADIDQTAKETFERAIFVAKGGDEYKKEEPGLEKLKERYNNAVEMYNTARVEHKDKPEKLKEIEKTSSTYKTALSGAYSKYEHSKEYLHKKFGISTRQEIEGLRNHLILLCETSQEKGDVLKRTLSREVEQYSAALSNYENTLSAVVDKVKGEKEYNKFLDKSSHYKNIVSDFENALKNISSEISLQEGLNEFLVREKGEYSKYINSFENLEKEILNSISAENAYIDAEKEYEKSLMEYEKENKNYEKELSRAREAYENVRREHEAEWSQAREELEKSPDEFKTIYQSLLEKYKAPWTEEHQKVVERGGLYVIGTERYEARRIDNQLKGRAGRQGDPGSSKYYLSLEDDLLRIFGAERMMGIMSHLPEGENITHPLITKMINNAQRKVEARNFEIRKQLLEFDNVLNEQRQVIYSLRQDTLEGKEMENTLNNFMEDVIEDIFEEFLNSRIRPEMWNIDGVKTFFKNTFEISLQLPALDDIRNPVQWKEKTKTESLNFVKKLYKEKKESAGDFLPEIQKMITLQVIDNRWKSQLRTIDELREGIGLRAYAQKDPLIAYKHEGYQMFHEMLSLMRQEVLSYLFKIQISQELAPSALKDSHKRKASFVHRRFDQFDTVSPNKEPIPLRQTSPEEPVGQQVNIQQTFSRERKKTGRNEPCPCGSGKKYKYCCGRNV